MQNMRPCCISTTKAECNESRWAVPHFSTCHPMLHGFLPHCCSDLCFSQLLPQQALCLSSPAKQGPLFFQLLAALLLLLFHAPAPRLMMY